MLRLPGALRTCIMNRFRLLAITLAFAGALSACSSGGHPSSEVVKPAPVGPGAVTESRWPAVS